MHPVFSDQSQDLTKQIFENIRNTLVCGSMAVAGVVIGRYPELSLLGPKAAPWIASGVLWMASLLCLWNIFIGAFTIGARFLKSRLQFTLIFLPATFLYFIASLGMLGGAVKLQSFSLQQHQNAVAGAVTPTAAASSPSKP